MNCPTCRQPMLVLELEEIEIDYCSACRGMWLDAGELELLLGENAQALDLLRSFRAAETGEQKRKCPICLKNMDKVHVGVPGQSQELIDRCPKYHGLWFDGGELQRILQKAHFDDNDKVKRLLGDLFFTNKVI
ncbi:MAG: zf-TFIIB domain-containing protein [Planctomycetaceae bacterium]|nr:zf-TFIIB domain-containing protein [Planctomycetaceae bacterium]